MNFLSTTGMNARSSVSSFTFSVFLLLTAWNVSAAPLTGTVSSNEGAPLSGCYLGLLNESWGGTASASSNNKGAFELAYTPEAKYLLAQPGPATVDGVQAFPFQPRLYVLGEKEANLKLVLPPAFSLVLEAYGADGKLLRWRDFEAAGKLGGQFLYAVNIEDESLPASIWPVHGKTLTGAEGGDRQDAVPAVLVVPGQQIAVNVLFWTVPEYGKLMVKADNMGKGFDTPKPGGVQVILLNHELARTAVGDLQRRLPVFPPEAQEPVQELADRLKKAAQLAGRPEQAQASDGILRDALKLRDDLEFARAKADIPKVRKGTLMVRLSGAEGADLSGYKVSISQQNHDFLFGAFEGSPYNAKAFEAARKGGFELATVLLGWNWAQRPQTRKSEIDQVYGISRLEKLGYRVKAHGVVWLQKPPILPEEAMTMPAGTLVQEALAQQQALLEVFGERMFLVEAMNEPANTNVVKLPRERMAGLMNSAAENIHNVKKAALVNSPHEFSFGSKYIFHRTDNQPLDDYPQTFSTFLTEQGTENVDIIGLQIYPGLHFNKDWNELQGPGYTPSFFVDTFDRYSRFGKAIHVTEFSLPSTYPAGWYNGYWREPWNEQTQADFAERFYTLAFAHPMVHSVGWWDIVDDKSSVITGGMIKKGGAAKEVFNRITGLIKEWTTTAAGETDTSGTTSFEAFGGEYSVIVTSPKGKKYEEKYHLVEGWTGTVDVKVGG